MMPYVRLVILLIAALCVGTRISPLAAQPTPVSGWCELGGQPTITSGVASTTKVQRSYPGCTVTVFLHGTTTKATIFTNAASSPLSNPFTANALASIAPGYWIFYATDRVDVQMSGAGIAAPFTLFDLNAGVGGGGGGGVTSFNTRSGAVSLQLSDVTNLGDLTNNTSGNAAGITGKTISGTGAFIPTYSAPLPANGAGHVVILGANSLTDSGLAIASGNLSTLSRLNINSSLPAQILPGSGALSSNSALARTCAYLVTTAAGTGGTASINIIWTDTATAHTTSPFSAVSLTTVGAFGQGCIVTNSAVGTTIQFSTTVTGGTGPLTYSLYLTSEILPI